MTFVNTGIGIVFIFLGVFLIYRGLVDSPNRERLIYSGLGAIAVGAGNVILPVDQLGGIAGLVIGMFLIYYAARRGR